MKSIHPFLLVFFVLSGFSLNAGTFNITADGSDTQLRSNGSTSFAGQGSVRVGGDSGTTDACGVFAFALPEIPEGEFILSANVQFYMSGVSNKPGPADAYALPYRSTSAWSSSDYYQGAYDEDPTATALQDDIFVVESPAGFYILNEIAAETLKEHIIAQYNAGAVAGDFVAIRLSPSRTDETNYYFYNVSTANNSVVENRPLLTIETFDGNHPPELDQAPLHSANVGATEIFNITASDVNEGDTLSFDSQDIPAFAELVDNGDGSATITVLAAEGDEGLHTFSVTVSDGGKQSSGPVSIVVKNPQPSGAPPLFEDLDPVSLNQGDGTVVNIAVTDSDDTSSTISAINLPAFATYQDNGDMTATLTIDTYYTDPFGDYTIFLVAEDDDGNTDVFEFSIQLIEVVFAPGYYCDPVNGDISNDGSPQRPWPSLQQVLAVNKVFQPGDTIYLRDGYHGEATANGSNADYVYIKPAEGHNPTLGKLSFGNNSSYWHASGLSISRSHAPSYSKSTMVGLGGTYNVVSDCDIFSVPDITAWEASDWTTLAANGVGMSGQHNILEDCTIMNTAFAVSTGTSSSFLTIRNNHIQNFSGDGIRALGNDQLIEYNYIADNYNVDGNHDDGIQGWSVSEGGGAGTGVTARITIRGNVIIETTDADRPLQGPLQGMGGFDGIFEEWVIENNMIIVNQWHGIALYGAINCRIVNNTVLDQDMSRAPGPTWITIEPHKDFGKTSDLEQRARHYGYGNVVSNNLTTDIYQSIKTRALRSDLNETIEGNIEIRASDINDYFVNYPFDVQLRSDSPAIDAGVMNNAPSIDIFSHNRPYGLGVDVGAHELAYATWAGFQMIDESWVKTVNFMDWINITFAPWVYQSPSNTWFHIEEGEVDDDGTWIFSAALIANEFGALTPWEQFTENSSGWKETPIGTLFVDGDWVYSTSLSTWCYLPESHLSMSGTWLFAYDTNP
jgi:parallel beta-helix repeat protein